MTSAQEHIAKVASAFQAEKQHELEVYKQLLDAQSPQERKKEGYAWFPIKVVDSGYGLASLPFVEVERNPGDKTAHKFGRGVPVTVIDENSGQQQFGHVLSVDDSRMRVALGGEDLPEWLDDGQLSVNQVFDTKTFEEGEKALSQVLNVEKGRLKDLREIIAGNEAAAFRKSEHFESASLNASQNQAVDRALTSEDVSVVFGPPGTGKTTTLVEIIQCFSKRDKAVLACAPSNAAVDHLTFKLSEKGLNVVRIGSVTRMHDRVFTTSLEHRVNTHAQSKEIEKLRREVVKLRKQASAFKRNFGPEERQKRKDLYREARQVVGTIKDLEEYVINDILGAADVITCTLVGSSSNYLKDRKFPVVVIDEAGQSLEPLCWVPILKSEKVILAGDPFQLPPTVKSNEAHKKGLSRTMLDLLIRKEGVYTMLDTQYRMNESIMTYSNQRFYEEKLRAHETVKDHSIDEIPVEFIDTAGCGFDEKVGEASQSRFNQGEIDILRKHLEASGTQDETAIITPYREQAIQLLQSGLTGDWIDINTVDSFQGQERDRVYISLVRSNEKGEIGFLKDYRRMNVAMTRARKKLIIIGDSATIGQDEFYGGLLDFCEQNGFYRSAWEYMT